MPDAPTIKCRACSTPVPASSRFCLSCGAPLTAPATAEETPTEYLPPPSSHASAPAEEERFPAGTVIAGRYRIAAQLGRGGMGEVYRATDLMLRQPVALKFLPEAASASPAVLDRLLNEVRIARQISHPNVCRVFDIGVHEGLHYISMEFVDGEDLASLLRRIGRLPGDKALEFSRRICAGLAAAHEKGVLHRDLKPSNIMIDGQGRVRIMDFGLAGWAGRFEGAEIRSGTPGYMAPEQMRGEEVTERSDIYSLGVTLYEMFTGKRAFEAATIAELTRLQTESAPATLSAVVQDLDPAVERVVLRCLDPEPSRRPASALAVAAALPGGDPLAAALAAGETPSPEMVAAAGAAEGVRPMYAVIALAIALAGMLVSAFASGRLSIVSRVPFENAPLALAGEARQILRSLGYTERPADNASGLEYNEEYLRYLERSSRSPQRWTALGQAAFAPVTFWYRTSPRTIVNREFFSEMPFPGVIATDAPPLTRPGMTLVFLDTRGRLTRFQAVTPRRESPPQKPKPVDWKPLLDAAGLDAARLTPAEPEWLPQAATDTRAAWTGTYADSKERIRVEAAAFRGRAVYFNIVGPWWTDSGSSATRSESAAQTAAAYVLLTLLALGVLMSCLLARRNVRLGRGDKRGAWRVGAFVAGALLVAWLLGSNHAADISDIVLAMMGASRALFMGALAWILYLALEPYARRLWPQTLIGWSRVLAGGWRDPLVGKDVLFGVAFGAAQAALQYSRRFLVERYGGALDQQDLFTLLSVRELTADLVSRVPTAVASGLMLFMLVFGLRSLLRRQWLAVAAFYVVIGGASVIQSTSDVPVVEVAYQMVGLSLFFVALLRYGLLTVVCLVVTANILVGFPLTLDFSAWYIGLSLYPLAALAALAAYAFRTALAGRAVWFKD